MSDNDRNVSAKKTGLQQKISGKFHYN